MADYVLTASGPIHEVDFGGTGPRIVLVHGLGGSTINWNAVAPPLARSAGVSAIDLPGFGLSPPRHDYHLETLRGSIVDYLETLGPTPTTLVGNSSGGLLSAMVAADRPDLVERLVLVSPATPPRFPDPRLDWPTVVRLAVQATPVIGEIYGRWFLRSNTPEQLVRKSLEMVTRKPGRVPMDLIADSRDMARIRKQLPWAEHATARAARSIAGYYARPAAFARMIRSITAETVVIQGVTDHIVSPTAVAWLCSLRPDWEHVVLEDTGHTPQMDAPLSFIAAVDDWLSRTAKQGAAG